MKTVLLVPGFQEDFKTRDYKSVTNMIKSKGYDVVFVPIQWKRRTISDWVAELEEVYSQYDPKETILAGFSYGSMTALVAANKRLPAELWLFSLSPYFSEDIPLLKLIWLRQVGKQRMERFWRTSFDKLYPAITCPVKLFAGEKEMKKYPAIGHRFRDAGSKFEHCVSVAVPDVGHDVTHAEYISAIKGQI